MQNIIFAWRQDFELNRFQSRHRCYSNQMWKLSSTNLAPFMRTLFLIDESLCHNRILFSSSHDLLASISHLLFEQFIDFYHDQFAQIWCLTIFTLATRHFTSTSHSTSLATLVHRFSTHSSRSLIITRDFHSWSLIVTRRSRHDHSSILETSLTIAHRRSTHSLTIAHCHSKRSLTITHHLSRFSLMIAHRHSTLSSRSFIDSRNILHDRSSSFDALVTIAHDHSRVSLTIVRHYQRSLNINWSCEE